MNQNSPTVFISCVKEDQEYASKLYDDLKKAGVQPWLSAKDLPVGGNIRAETHRIMEESSYFLALISENSVSQKGMIHRELNMAFDIMEELPFADIFIIPIRLDKIKVSDYRLKDIHFADFSDSYEKGLKEILRVAAPDTVNNTIKETKEETPEKSFEIKEIEFKKQLVKTLLSCRTISDRGTRNTVIEELPSEIKNSIIRHDATQVDVMNLINRCLDFKDGLDQLAGIIRFFEGDSDCMKQVDDLLET